MIDASVPLSFPIWPFLALGFSFIGACIIGYNHRFQVDGRVMAVWRVGGVLPIAFLSWLLLPWPTSPLFYAVSVGLGFAAVVGDVLLMNASATYGGRLSSLYVPIKMLIAFVLWSLVQPASLEPVLAEPWRLAVVLASFAAASWGMGHIRRNDVGWKAVLAVVPVAVIFACEDTIQKYVLPTPVGAGAPEIIGSAMAMLSVMLTVGALPALVWLRGVPAFHARDVWPSVAFGALLMSGISVLLVTFVLAPNPGYVAAITCLSTVWLALWARYKNGEYNNPAAMLAMVAAAIGIALATH